MRPGRDVPTPSFVRRRSTGAVARFPVAQYVAAHEDEIICHGASRACTVARAHDLLNLHNPLGEPVWSRREVAKMVRPA